MLARHHHLVRFAMLAAIVVSVTYMAHRAVGRVDLTAAGLSELTPGTEELVAGITPERPVFVHAFVSDEVPSEYVAVRSRLLNLLRAMESAGGDGLQVRIVAPEPYSEEAQEAIDSFGISPRPLVSQEGGRAGAMEVFLGVAFVSGPREEVIEFMDRGLSTEYELVRALRVVLQDEKKTVGILGTDVPLMGRFDMQAGQTPPWRIVGELRKQYQVRTVPAAQPVPEDVDVLLVPQLSSLTQEGIDQVKAYLDAGRPALILVDPMPLFDLRVSPGEPMLPPPGQQQQMFGGAPPAGQKGDHGALLRELGLSWPAQQILYDTYQPHRFFDAPPQVAFIGARPEGASGLGDDATVRDLAEVVVLFGGVLEKVAGTEAEITPLLSSGETSGFNEFKDMVSRNPIFGLQGPIAPRTRSPITGEQHMIAARVRTAAPSGGQGEASGEDGEDGAGASGAAKGRHAIVVADLDLFSNQMFGFHESSGDVDGDGIDDIRFDNVTFLLNAIDSLAGDERFLTLRSRRPDFRRLTAVDEMTLAARQEREEKIDEANEAAEKALEEAKASLEAAVEEIRGRADLDETAKATLLESVQTAENRRLQARQERIEQQKKRDVVKIETEHRRRVEEVKDGIRLVAVLLPPVPALLMGAFIFARKRRREREQIPRARRKGAGTQGGAA